MSSGASPCKALGQPSLLREIQAFVGEEFLYVGCVSNLWYEAWCDSAAAHGALPRRTSRRAALTSARRLAWGLDSGLRWTEKLSFAAAKCSQALELLQIGVATGCVRLAQPQLKTRLICEAAAATGQLTTLQWARSHGCPCDGAAASAAAAAGQLDVLRWLWETGSPIDVRACRGAAFHGHVAVLQFLRAARCAWDNNSCLFHAIARGHLNVLEWLLLLTDAQRKEDDGACTMAAANGRVEALQLLRAQGFSWSEETFAAAASEGHLEVLEWLRVNECPWNEDAFARAALRGRAAVLQWLQARGCPFDAHATASAAREGHLEALQWLRAQGCPWTGEVCQGAVEGGHKALLEWAHSNGCPCKHNS